MRSYRRWNASRSWRAQSARSPRDLAFGHAVGFGGHHGEYTQRPCRRMPTPGPICIQSVRPRVSPAHTTHNALLGSRETDMTQPYRMIAAAVAAALAASVSQASSHREAPNITRMPAVDATDFYLFNSYERGRSEYVTVLANYLPLQDPYGGPNYFALDPYALYEIHLDNDGDASEDLTFQFRFRNRLVNDKQGLALDIGGESVARAAEEHRPGLGGGPLTARIPRGLLADAGARRPAHGQCGPGPARGRRLELVRQALRLRRHQDIRQRRGLRGVRELVHPGDQHPRLREERPRLRRPARRALRGEPRPRFRPGQHRPGRRQRVSGRDHPGPGERHHRRQEHHDDRTRAAEAVRHRPWQRRDRRLDDGVDAQDAHHEHAVGRRIAGRRQRRVGAGLASRRSARQRSRHRPARQGRLQCQRAAPRRAVRDLRDEPDAAGAASTCCSATRSTRRSARRSRTSRRRTCRGSTS